MLPLRYLLTTPIINHQADLRKLLSCWASKYSPFAANKKNTCQPTNKKNNETSEMIFLERVQQIGMSEAQILLEFQDLRQALGEFPRRNSPRLPHVIVCLLVNLPAVLSWWAPCWVWSCFAVGKSQAVVHRRYVLKAWRAMPMYIWKGISLAYLAYLKPWDVLWYVRSFRTRE